MPSAFDYLEMARECMREADATKDAARKKALLDIARLYAETAVALEPDPPPTGSKAHPHKSC
jgi:hypothetical protein